jgi:hypothetical protein
VELEQLTVREHLETLAHLVDPLVDLAEKGLVRREPGFARVHRDDCTFRLD